MTVKIEKSSIVKQSKITITGSKSESNRLLLLKALYPELEIENVSNSDDSKVMQKALASEEKVIDIHHAGTAMRFLTAYFASNEGREVVLTGSARMKERPIKILVDALNDLGADISYLETAGCPPIQIKGKRLTRQHVRLNANVSSQYISALILIASRLENGLILTLEGEMTSVPYINMTLDLLRQVAIETTFNEQVIEVKPKKESLKNKKLTVESDWSSASYFYSIVALSPVDTQIELSSYKKESLQGDSVLAEIYASFGVETVFFGNSIALKKTSKEVAEIVEFQLNNSPDIAQTIAVTCLGLGIKCHLTGLHTLKIKETDRLVALQNELQKFGAEVDITEESLTLYKASQLRENVVIATYNDHRMAMAFAPLGLKTNLEIEDYMVVSKSYPTFWDDLKNLGFKFSK
ncbi:3-phosphoshikimate 1-carboxyvinyltransferase [Psychroserpens sp. Hel_I_66]|uniref:3-phosphoshikimate 1-carboxyvinyltransferase n=1 Tax=Psychroserpens sp. Hel_I_66 TaxID=1250004 RepID=UPI000647E6AF|nr:3-phosphoshikimate 1-carboxyvinyltransferase [Psychroserpens sp. Hel_I_66]